MKINKLSGMKTINRLFSYATVVLALLELLLIVGSWIMCTVFPESSFRTLLSSEGIRWFFGSFVANLQSELLVWLLLLLVGYGCFSECGLVRAVKRLSRHGGIPYRERIALMICLSELVVSIVVMILLTCVPQAILCSVTGDLFPSDFSVSAVATLSFVLLMTGTTFGVTSRSFRNIYDWTDSMLVGIRDYSFIFVLYIFSVQLVCSVGFVMSL